MILLRPNPFVSLLHDAERTLACVDSSRGLLRGRPHRQRHQRRREYDPAHGETVMQQQAASSAPAARHQFRL